MANSIKRRHFGVLNSVLKLQFHEFRLFSVKTEKQRVYSLSMNDGW